MAIFCDTACRDLLVVLATVCFCVTAYVVRIRNTWTRKGIPVIDPLPFVGNLKDVLLRKKTIGESVRDFYLNTKKNPYVGFFAFTQPMVMINDLDMLKNVMIKDFQFFADRNIGSTPRDVVSHYNVFGSRGQFWKTLRMKLTPTFTSGKMKKMFELVDACGNGFVKYLEREKDSNGDVEVKEASARFTCDVIASCFFGLEGDALVHENSTFRIMMRKVMTFGVVESLRNLVAFLYPWVIERFDIVLTKPDVAEYCRKTVWDTAAYREKNKVTRNDFLDLLLQLRSRGKVDEDEDEEREEDRTEKAEVSTEKFELDGDVLVAQCFIFMLAGFETSSTTMSWALYEMALQPDIQQRAYDEIAEVLEKHGGKVTYEAIQEMTYLNMLVHETLRKYPVLPFLDRRVTQPYKIPGTEIVLERGQGVMIPVLGIHSDPAIYPEPERFDPERFTAENIQERPSCSFLGFGDGPRNCIGMRMGLVQTKVGLVYLLKNYVVTPCEKTPIPIVFDADSPAHSAKGGITLRLQTRT